MTDFHKIARAKFPYGEIRGDGRWACVRRCGQGATRRWRISLHVDQDHADKAAERQCPYGCQGLAYHFTLPIAPPEMPRAPEPVVRTVEEPPPLFGLMMP
jgi:hypothetical protein